MRCPECYERPTTYMAINVTLPDEGIELVWMSKWFTAMFTSLISLPLLLVVATQLLDRSNGES